MIYDQPSIASFSKKIESVQYNGALAIMGAMKGCSHEKFEIRTRISLSKKMGEKIVLTL